MRASGPLLWAAEVLAVVLLLPLAAAVAASSGATEVWGDGRTWAILGRSLAFSAVSATAATIVAFVVGRGGLVWSAIACVPLLIPSSLLGSAWILLLGRGGPLGAWVTVYAWPVAAAAVGLRYAGVGAIVLALHRRREDDAARVFPVRRAWWWLEARPMLRPAAIAWGAMLLLCGADHIMPSVFLVQTYGTQVLIQYNALLDLAGAAALATPMLALGAAAVALATAFVRPRPADGPPGRPVRAPRASIAVAVAMTAIPLAAVAWNVESVSAVADAARGMRQEIVHTLVLAVAGGLTCGAAGWLLAERWLDCRRGGRWSLAPLVAVNLAVPASLPALGVIALCGRLAPGSVADGHLPLMAAYAARFTPLAMLVVFAGGLRRSELPVAAASVLGVRRSARLLHVHWPRRRRSVAAAVLLVGVGIATELEMSILLTPAGATTVGVRLYTLIHTAPDTIVGASALVVCLTVAPAVALLAVVIARGRSA